MDIMNFCDVGKVSYDEKFEFNICLFWEIFVISDLLHRHAHFSLTTLVLRLFSWCSFWKMELICTAWCTYEPLQTCYDNDYVNGLLPPLIQSLTSRISRTEVATLGFPTAFLSTYSSPHLHCSCSCSSSCSFSCSHSHAQAHADFHSHAFPLAPLFAGKHISPVLYSVQVIDFKPAMRMIILMACSHY